MVSREMREMTPMSFTERFGEFPSREGLTILVVSIMLYFILYVCTVMCVRALMDLCSPLFLMFTINTLAKTK